MTNGKPPMSKPSKKEGMSATVCDCLLVLEVYDQEFVPDYHFFVQDQEEENPKANQVKRQQFWMHNRLDDLHSKDYYVPETQK